jgi:hypothetical protein
MNAVPTREEEIVADRITCRVDEARTRLSMNPRMFMSVVRDIVLEEIMKSHRRLEIDEDETKG